MAPVDYVCLFVRASGDRLRGAEGLVLALPQLLGDALLDCGFRYQASAKLLGVTVHLRTEGLAQAKRDRLVFWTARAGGRAMAVEAMTADDRGRLEAHLAKPSHNLSGVASEDLFDLVGEFFTSVGAAPDRRRNAAGRPQLVIDVGGPGWEGVRWDAAERRLFVAAPFAPPVGDEVPLFVRVPGNERPIEARGTVVEVRRSAAAAPGAPAGYVLRLEDPPAVFLEALAAHSPAHGGDSRIAPRFHVNAPVKLLAPGAAPAPPPQPGAPRALVEYATDQELAADFIQNLSQGGAYVRTSAPPPVGSAVELELRLPNGAELRASAVVAFADANGMGVRFQLDAEAEAILANAMAHISARPRRALVVDDDALVCRMIADALRDRGFEVVTAASASEGLSTLAEELLALDLLVTDVVMPGMTGEEFVRVIRQTGGEVDLAIVVVTGRLSDGLEGRLEEAGADAVLDKSLGAELVAQAADAVLERRRLLAQSQQG
jgi:uncharacterized protein (TIGR02266 family)